MDLVVEQLASTRARERHLHGTRLRGIAERGAATQTTLRRALTCEGIGLHGGARVTLAIRPAPADHGISFRRTDLEAGGRAAMLPARHDRVADTRLCTVLADPLDPALRVGTIEHVMAALAGLAIDNATIEVDGPELPILDGSSLPFVELIGRAGRAASDVPRREIVVRRRVRVSDGDGFAELSPCDDFALDVSIDFTAAAIGRQSLRIEALDAASFRRELAGARTFTLLDEVARLRDAGLGRGGSLANAVVVDGDEVLNPEGLRAPDEFVRHKMLDAVGDLALAGGPIRGRYVAHRPGHGLNNRLLRALFADAANWQHAAASGRRAA